MSVLLVRVAPGKYSRQNSAPGQYRGPATIGGLILATFGVSAVAFAQAITGTVKDAGGRSLHGVEIRAASPALIEQSHTAVTNESGQYRIDGLRPGIYTVTFTFTGFRPHRLEDVVLSGSFTATIDATLTPGSLSESIVVVGTVSTIDVHSANRELTFSGELLKSLPTVRTYNAMVTLVPGVVTNANDVVTGTATTAFPIYGGRANEGRLLLDGLTVGSPPSGNSATSYVVDLGNAEEATFLMAGTLGEVETGGLVMNIVPRSGGNVLHGSLFASGTGAQLQSDNLTPSLKAQGLTSPTPLSRVYDISGTLGGAILNDRAWYFVNAHSGGSRRQTGQIYDNLNAGDDSQWLYEPDPHAPAYSDRTFENASMRVTWQLSPRHKIGGFWDAQSLCRNCTGATAGLQEPARVSPEAVGILSRPLHVTQATWTSPVSSRMLVEAGYGGTFFGVGNFERQPNPTRELIRVVEQCANGCAANGNIPGLVYRSQDFSTAYAGSYLWKGSLSYEAVGHSLKVGYQHTLMTDDRTWFTNDQNLTYRLNNGVPNQFTQSISPWVNNARAAWDALYAQHRWTFRRLTLHGALRFDRATSWFPEQRIGPSRFLPEPIVIPKTTGVDSYKDITPRMGASYSVFPSGRTVVSMTLGRFLEGAGVSGHYANANPTLRMPRTTPAFGTAGVTRAWTDTNGNFVPDCDLMSPAPQDLRATGGDQCGALSNANFGQNVLTNDFDPRVLSGWGVRPSDWNLTTSLQQQLFDRASLAVSYVRRWYDGFSVVDNVLLQPADLTPFAVTAPNSPALPGGGGYVVGGLYDVVPDKFGQISGLVTDARQYGAWSQYFNGVDVTASVRASGFNFVGGTSTGQTVSDNCGVRANLPELSTSAMGTSAFGAGLMGSAVTAASPYCHVASGLLTQFKAAASYLLPWGNFQVSTAIQSKPGPMLVANWEAPNAAVAPSLGRALSGNASNVTVNLVTPGTMYGPRINQIDLRVAKLLQHGDSRTMLAVDLYNLMNSSAGLAYNPSFAPEVAWPMATAIQTPRFIRFTAEFTF